MLIVGHLQLRPVIQRLMTALEPPIVREILQPAHGQPVDRKVKSAVSLPKMLGRLVALFRTARSNAVHKLHQIKHGIARGDRPRNGLRRGHRPTHIGPPGKIGAKLTLRHHVVGRTESEKALPLPADILIVGSRHPHGPKNTACSGSVGGSPVLSFFQTSQNLSESPVPCIRLCFLGKRRRRRIRRSAKMRPLTENGLIPAGFERNGSVALHCAAALGGRFAIEFQEVPI